MDDQPQFIPKPQPKSQLIAKSFSPQVIDGQLLDQDVEVIINAWNRNFVPAWLLLPQGVAGAIKRRGGFEPFRELKKVGLLPSGGAVWTCAGKLPYRGIIHVAGLTSYWRATEFSVKQSVISAMRIINERGVRSVAFPVIGAGASGFKEERAILLMQQAFAAIESTAEVRIVRYRPKP